MVIEDDGNKSQLTSNLTKEQRNAEEMPSGSGNHGSANLDRGGHGDAFDLDEYEATTQASINPFGEKLSDYDYQTTPVAYAESITSSTVEYAEGFAYCPTSDSLYASALADYQGSGASSASGSMIAWKDQIIITAELPKLHLKFNYYLYVEVDASESASGSNGHAEGSLHPTLIDFTSGSSYLQVLWEVEDSLNLDYLGGIKITDTTSGSIDEIIDLIPGHQYGINFYPFQVQASAQDNVRAWAYGEITDIDLQLVPLPSSLLLASTGLLGLLAWRRQRKF